jgi:hypothetical protein
MVLASGTFAQTPAGGRDASKKPGTGRVVFYYSTPAPIKDCMTQRNVQIDSITVHEIYQWHVWQTDIAPGVHVFSDDTRKDEGLTVNLVASQTYYYALKWRKEGFGLPACGHLFTTVSEMKPEEIEKAIALIGKPGVDESAATPPSLATTTLATPAPEVTKTTSRKLLIPSNTEAADIEEDGSFMGNTPSALELTLGEHTVGVRKGGYKPWQRKIKLAGGDIKLNAKLEKDTLQP